jgi:2-polyprenyl-3-methyl-5-hydroxy-6-metoxy-1,4-benzoquinol methylase
MKSNIKKVETSCNNCGSSDSFLITEGREHEYNDTTDDLFRVVRCRDCGMAYLNPRPDVSELAVIYPSNYYAYSMEESLADGANGFNLYRWIRSSTVKQMLKGSLQAFFGERRQLKILDVGCGDGHLLNCFAALPGYEIETHGVEIGAKAASLAEKSGHAIHQERFETAELPDEYFDLVFASHVIEHVEDPRAFALKARAVLRPGGVFAFWTPNIDSAEAKWFQKQHWGQYHFPRHWHFYNPSSVRKLADLTDFEVLGIDFAPNGVSWVYTLHSVCKSNPLLAPHADKLFPVVGWSKTTPVNFVRNGFFVGVELLLKLCTGQTSNMGVAFRKPK